MKYRNAIALSMLAVLAAACDDEKPAPAPALLAPTPIDGQGVRAYVVQEPGATADRVTLTIRIQSKDLGVAAYQGRLEFDKDAIEIIEATSPSDDGTRLVNPNAGVGMLKFAGFATEKFTGNTAATLIVHPLKPLDQANFVATLDVAGESNGSAVQAARLMPARGLFLSAAP